MKVIAEYKLTNRRVEEIDLLKGFSIFTIVLMHLMNYMECIPSQILKLSLIGGPECMFFSSVQGLDYT